MVLCHLQSIFFTVITYFLICLLILSTPRPHYDFCGPLGTFVFLDPFLYYKNIKIVE